MKRMRELRYRRFYADRLIDTKITVNWKKALNDVFFMFKFISYLVLGHKRRLVADRSLGMFQMVANCELRQTGTQTSDVVVLSDRTLRTLCKKH